MGYETKHKMKNDEIIIKGDWNHRPTGCRKTISGMHIPKMRKLSYTTISVFCDACGLTDDVGEFTKWLFGEGDKIDDRNEKQG